MPRMLRISPTVSRYYSLSFDIFRAVIGFEIGALIFRINAIINLFDL